MMKTLFSMHRGLFGRAILLVLGLTGCASPAPVEPDPLAGAYTVPADAGLGPSTPGTMTITGTVYYWLHSAPVHEATVTIGATTVATDSEGEFTIADVEVPYDIEIVSEVDDNTIVHIIEGLTLENPHIDLRDLDPQQSHGFVKGTVSPVSGLPLPANTRIVVAADSWSTSGDTFDASAGPYVAYSGWAGLGSHEATVYAVEYTVDDAGLPIAILGHGSQTILLSPGETVTDVDLELSPPETNTLTLSSPEHETPESVTLGVQLFIAPSIFIFLEADGAGPLTFVYPILPESTAMAFVMERTPSGDGWSRALAPLNPDRANDIVLETQSPSGLTPADDAIFDPETPFSFEGDGPHLFRVVSVDQRFSLTVVTNRDESYWPREHLPESGEYTWQGMHYYSLANTDDLVATPGQYLHVSRATSEPRDLTVP